MKLASLKTGGRDGSLIIVNRTLTHYLSASEICPILQKAVENWDEHKPALEEQYTKLNDNPKIGNPLSVAELSSPLPRAYQWLDGSAYLSHVERVRKARGAEMPPSFKSDPLMYQGGSDYFLGPTDPIYASSEEYGIDFESEVAIITNDVPMAINPQTAGDHIILLMIVNDVSLRNLIPAELAKGFGFLHGKPPTAFSPVAVTPDELGQHWENNKVHLPLLSTYNGSLVGDPNAGQDMQFSFAELIAHAAKTRPLGAGTIIGSGTVSNQDLSKGYSCFAEKRVLEIIESGEAKTPFMKFGDRIRVEMNNDNNESIFGVIEQDIRSCKT